MFWHCCLVVVVVNVGDNGDGNEIYILVTIAKCYANSFNHLCIDKMPLVLNICLPVVILTCVQKFKNSL